MHAQLLLLACGICAASPSARLAYLEKDVPHIESTFEPPAKNVVFSLVRGLHLDEIDVFMERSQCLIGAMASDELYDQIVFHTGELTEGALASEWRTRTAELKRLRFVDARDFGGFDSKHAPFRPEDADYPLGYHHMCHFMSTVWFKALAAYEYAMRVDDDVCVVAMREKHPFTWMAKEGLAFAYGAQVEESHTETVETMPPWLAEYARNDPTLGPPPSDAGKSIYFTNFFISEVSWWWTPPVQKFLNAVDASENIYKHRWGDAPIATSALMMLAPASNVARLPTQYLHLSTMDEIGMDGSRSFLSVTALEKRKGVTDIEKRKYAMDGMDAFRRRLTHEGSANVSSTSASSTNGTAAPPPPPSPPPPAYGPGSYYCVTYCGSETNRIMYSGICGMYMCNPAAAGDDPIFVGADGIEYEVLGEPGSAFNLLSSAGLSINAEFVAVPDAFKGAMAGNVSRVLTDTTLGSIHLAACDGAGALGAAGSRLEMLLDVKTGGLRCTLAENAAAAAETPCGRAMAAVGMAMSHERSGCLLDGDAGPSCGYYAMPASAEEEALPSETAALLADASLLQVGMARFNLSIGGSSLSILRDVVGAPAPAAAIDCQAGPFAKRPTLQEACAMLARVYRGEGEVEPWLAQPAQTRTAVLAALSQREGGRQFYFSNVRVERMGLPQEQVHGLLGQRAVKPRSEHVPGVSSDKVAAGVAASGRASDFGHQGEGAIEGVYTDYKVAQIGNHAGFAHSRFRCA